MHLHAVLSAIFQQQHKASPLIEEDFFGSDGLINHHIDWDEVMLDWGNGL